MWGLDQLAKDCGTTVEPQFPIFVVMVNGKVAAYYYAHPHVTIRPTVHPSLMTPREFLETASLVIAVSKRAFSDPLWLIDQNSKLANPEILGRVGLQKEDLAIYR
jgi:hypothetical protein